MSISLEKIDLLKERANVGYKEAKEALEQCDGDLVEALIWLEDKEKIKKDNDSYNHSRTGRDGSYRSRAQQNDYGKKIEDGVKKVHSMRFKIYKDDDTLLNLPATVALVVGVFTLPMSLIALLAAVLFRYHIALIKPDGDSVMDDQKVKDTIREEFTGEKQPESEENKAQANESQES
ncbi:DUF4342 domain-containing protein [Fusibacter sp. JL216-2]|uniref:DUF4342 domain-containing protein n=1 Tax=Fusibacter sp. JL216-2 TaxID=3071453 RepID=UPI003D350359